MTDLDELLQQPPAGSDSDPWIYHCPAHGVVDKAEIVAVRYGTATHGDCDAIVSLFARRRPVAAPEPTPAALARLARDLKHQASLARRDAAHYPVHVGARWLDEIADGIFAMADAATEILRRGGGG